MINLEENQIYTIIPTSLQIGSYTFIQDEQLEILKIDSPLVTVKRLSTNEIIKLEKLALIFTVERLGA